MQPVGQLDQDDADVLDHGEQHLADALGLAVLAVGEVDFAQLGDAVDAARHVLAEGAARVPRRLVWVSSRTSCSRAVDEADLIHLHFGQDPGHLERVGHVGLAGNAASWAEWRAAANSKA